VRDRCTESSEHLELSLWALRQETEARRHERVAGVPSGLMSHEDAAYVGGGSAQEAASLGLPGPQASLSFLLLFPESSREGPVHLLPILLC
jgi:hypothetical protein